MATISRRLLALAVATRLVGVTNATGYMGAVGSKYGLPGVTGTPENPPPKSSTDPRVQPYFVVFVGAGAPGLPGGVEVDLGDTLEDLTMPFQITAAGGDINDVLALVDRIHDRLYRWAPVISGIQAGPLRIPAGYDPGPVLTDKDFTPRRLFTPLRYQLTAHT